MIDDDDVSFTAVTLSTTSGDWIWFLICVAIVVVMSCIVTSNKDECSRMRCPVGLSPKLMEHECLCTTKAVSDGPEP